MPRIGFPELIVILIIALVFFGPGKLPEMGKAAGEALKEFKKATGEIAGGATGTSEAKAETKMEAQVENIKSEVVK